MMETVREEKAGDFILRLLRLPTGEHKGVVVKPKGGTLGPFAGSDADTVWTRLQEEAARANGTYTGFDAARLRFERFFPGGFTDARYMADERTYKLAAKVWLDTNAPLDAARHGTGYGPAALAAFKRTNLLSPFETVKLPALLNGPSADAFIQAAAAFAIDGSDIALQGMRHAAKLHECAKWTVLTYLPFLWRPEEHMFLKPIVTTDFAARTGHPFAHTYRPDLDIEVYRSLQHLVVDTTTRLASLGPRDRIDVQGFIFVVGGYTEKDAPGPL